MKKPIIFLSIVLFFLGAVICPLIITSCPGSSEIDDTQRIGREDDDWTDDNVNRITVLDYFKQLAAMSESRAVMAGHNYPPVSRPGNDTDTYAMWTDRYPAMYSNDFCFDNLDVSEDSRWTMIREVRRQWEIGNIVHLLFHVTTVKFPSDTDVGIGSTWTTNDPNIPGVVTEGDAALTPSEWTDLLTEGGTLNTRWKKRLEVYYPYFQYLKDYGVTVLFRPFHEMNITAFWWGSTQANAQSRTAELFRMTRELFDAQGFDNILWVWNMQDLGTTSTGPATITAWNAYNPGLEYWDIFCVDLYGITGYPDWMHEAATSVANGRPIGIGECFTLPTAAQLADQPNWTFVMPWPAGLNTTPTQMNTLYAADNTLVHGQLPPFVRGNTVNLVRNPGFTALYEGEPKLPRAWTTSWTGGEAPVTVEHGRFVGDVSSPYGFTMSQIITNLTPGEYEFSAFFKKDNNTIIGSQSIVMNVYSSDGVTILATRNISGAVAALQTPNVNNTYSNDHWLDLSVTVPGTAVKIEIVVSGIRNYFGISGASFRKK